jgi:hypothetical protein
VGGGEEGAEGQQLNSCLPFQVEGLSRTGGGRRDKQGEPAAEDREHQGHAPVGRRREGGDKGDECGHEPDARHPFRDREGGLERDAERMGELAESHIQREHEGRLVRLRREVAMDQPGRAARSLPHRGQVGAVVGGVPVHPQVYAVRWAEQSPDRRRDEREQQHSGGEGDGPAMLAGDPEGAGDHGAALNGCRE